MNIISIKNIGFIFYTDFSLCICQSFYIIGRFFIVILFHDMLLGICKFFIFLIYFFIMFIKSLHIFRKTLDWITVWKRIILCDRIPCQTFLCISVI